MDVSYTNVLAGARPYFQGLPAGGAGAASYYGEAAGPPGRPAGDGRPPVPVSASGWPPQQHPPPADQKRPPTREQTPNQRTSEVPHAQQYVQDHTRQYHNLYQEQANQNYQFSRPQSRDINQYGYQTPSSPQVPRVPSREQIAQGAQYQNTQNYQQNCRTQGYEQTFEKQQGYSNFQRAYYPVQPSQSTSNAVVSNSSYTSSGQSYQSSVSSQNSYYKHIYSSQTAHMGSYNQQKSQQPQVNSYHQQINNNNSNSRSSNDQNMPVTHNLPPIAAIPTMHSNKNVKVPNKMPSSSQNSYTAGLTSTYPKPSIITTNASSYVQNNLYPTSSISNNQQSNNYRPYNHNQQNYPYSSTSTAQSYQSVIVTSNTTSIYTTSNQTQQSSNNSNSNTNNNNLQRQNQLQQNQPQHSKISQSIFKRHDETAVAASSNHYHNVYQQQQQQQQQQLQHSQQQQSQQQPQANHVNDRLASSVVSKQKREISPLDLSVKTVRTPADSTLEESESKYYRQPVVTSSMSTHSYPTLDVSSIQRNFTQSSFPTAPKVEFRPNFNVPNMGHISKPTSRIHEDSNFQKNNYSSSNNVRSNVVQPNHQTTMNHNNYPSVSIPTSSYVNSYLPTRPNMPYNNNGKQPEYNQFGPKKSGSGIPYETTDINKKRASEVPSNIIPTKVPKVETWRQSIDFQIDEKFNKYEKEQQRLKSSLNKSTINGTYASVNNSKSVYQNNVDSFKNQQLGYNTHPTCVTYTSSSHTHSYVLSQMPQSQHFAYQPQHSQGLTPSSRSFSNSSLTSNKSSGSPGVDKRVLSLLRNSLEVKEQKKLEQQKSLENLARLDVQHPSTDVTAPVQPKTGLTGRNASPFTSTSFPENSVVSMYKSDKPNFEQDIKSAERINVATGDFDGLAAAFYAAARVPVRTKGELKQVLSHTNHTKDMRLQEFIESQIKSPLKQGISHESSLSSGTISTSTNNTSSPVKTLKERQNAFVPRKRLFSRNDDDPSTFPRDKSGLRSSSETSVFDFPDSESENEMPVLERQSLNSMRKDRSMKHVYKDVEIKSEIPEMPPSPGDDIFSKLCDNFVEQLKNGPSPSVSKKKKVLEDDMLNSSALQVQETVDKVEIKQEVIKESCADKEIISINDAVIEPKEVVKEEPPKEIKRSALLSDDSDNEVLAKKLNKEQKIDINPSEVTEEITKTIKEEPAIKAQEDSKEKPDSTPNKKSSDVHVIRPAKKPSFGDGSDFYPGWEEGVYKYKKSLRMPPSLIQVTRPPSAMRASSLPDLDPCPQSPTTSVTASDIDPKESKKSLRKVKSDPTDSDSESTSSFNIFSHRTNYDSEGSSSITSLPNTKKESQSIIDKLLERYGGKKRKKYKRKDDHSPKVIPKAENPVELLPTPSLEVGKTEDDETKALKKLKSPVVKAQSAILGFRKDTIKNFKDAFINSSNSILTVHDKFTTVVLKSRTRKESRVLKQRATIKEVFGEDRPASAPPVTCLNDLEIKQEIDKDVVFSSSLQEIVIKKEMLDEIRVSESDNNAAKQLIKSRLLDKSNTRKNIDNLLKTLTEKKIKTEIEEDEEMRNLHDIVIKKDPDSKSETPSLDGDEGSVSGKRRSKFGKIRRKFSSGFDYLRKKRKVKKDNVENESGEKKDKRKKGLNTKIPESIDDIQKEIKSWVLNKGIGETHLHRAARLGYADVVAYCLEKMDCHPSPKDNAGYTPLHEACSRGHLDIAKLLLKYGANVHESAQGGIRPLHEAVENGFIEIIRLLLSYGADPTLATYAGVVPLDLVSDEDTKNLLVNYMTDKDGEGGMTWSFHGPASCFDPLDDVGYNLLEDAPESDNSQEEEDIDIEMSEMLLPNLYTLRGEPTSERWVLLQDLSNILKIKSRDALLRQICPPSTSTANVNYKSGLRELKMTDFLEQARCCQFLNQGEKINTRASKIALVKYTDKVRELLGIENALVTNR